MTRAMVGYAWIKCQPRNKSAGHANPPYKRRRGLYQTPKILLRAAFWKTHLTEFMKELGE